MSANSPSEHYANHASCSAAPGMPSEETIARALNLAARAMQRQFGANDTEEAIEAAIWQYLRPAFEAKDAEIEALKKLATEHLQARYHAEARERNAHLAVQEERKLADAAEAKLAQAVEDERDAARYRHMRESFVRNDSGKHDLRWFLPWRSPLTAEGLDEAIDRARSASRGET